MALTAAQFVAIRGEFNAVYEQDPGRVQAALDSAYRGTDAAVFGTDTDDAAMWLAAHTLTADPLGSDTRIIGKKAIPIEAGTLYMQERKRLAALHAVCYGIGGLGE